MKIIDYSVKTKLVSGRILNLQPDILLCNYLMLRILYKNLLGKQWLAWLWTFLIVLACSWPGKDIPAAPVAGFDKIVHIGMFIGWTILWLSIFPSKPLTVIIVGMLFGLGLEFYQQLLPFSRTFDLWDALADAVGVIIGYGFTVLVVDPYRQRLY